ncbi:MAG TPA: hypothetical protein VFS05_00425 [Gemmatimonadaceae bacterium]|nr:hypothetical protein [Gemmatimonadaceae bacterium]
MPSRLRILALLPLLAACATTGATFRSGVGDRILKDPPYYAGASVAGDTARVGHLPVGYQRGGSQAPIFDPAGGAGTPVAALLAEMNAYLDSLGATVRIGAAPAGTPPDVRFGCETDAMDECVRSDSSGALGRGNTTNMRLAVGRPSPEWTAAAQRAMTGAGVGRALVVTLEVGQYWTTQSGLRGDKSVKLGTGHTAQLPWLTSLETPVTVVQLTGALMSPDGTAVRIGAEGMLPKRTRFSVSAIGGQELITGDDVQRLRTERREELPGRPLVWQVAMRQLVAQLAGRPELASR